MSGGQLHVVGPRTDQPALAVLLDTFLFPRNGVAPVVSLDSKKYKLVQQLNAATPSGTPSLIGCDRLTVEGDVRLPGAAVFKVSPSVQIVEDS